MATSTFSKIDSNQIASNRQVYAVACHFANIHAKNPSERYGLTKVFNAILNKTYRDQDSYMTHGEATEFFEWDCVPPQFLHMVSKPKKAKKVAKKSAETVKTQKKATPKGKAKEVKSTAKPTASDKKMQKLEKRVDILDRKLDKILDALTM